MGDKKRIPVKLDGVHVGEAEVGANGEVSIKLNIECVLSPEVMQDLYDGSVVGLSVKPTITPIVASGIDHRLYEASNRWSFRAIAAEFPWPPKNVGNYFL